MVRSRRVRYEAVDLDRFPPAHRTTNARTDKCIITSSGSKTEIDADHKLLLIDALEVRLNEEHMFAG